MRKRIYVGILIFSMVIVLAGCITIPIGDKGVIKISEAGVEFVEADDDDEQSASSNPRGDSPSGDSIVGQDSSSTPEADDQEKKEIVPEEVAKKEEKGEEDKSHTYNPKETSTKYEGEPEEDTECNFDYSELTDHIGTDIYIPYCAILLGVVEFPTGVSAGFLVDLVSYDHILNNYKAFLGSSRNPDLDLDLLDPQEILISGKLKDGGKLFVHLEQREGYVYLLLDYH